MELLYYEFLSFIGFLADIDTGSKVGVGHAHAGNRVDLCFLIAVSFNASYCCSVKLRE